MSGTAVLVPCPNEAIKMGFTFAWVFWSGSLYSQDVILYSPISGAINYLPCPSGAAVWNLYSSLFAGLNQARVCTEYPRQMRPLVLLYRHVKPWAAFSVQVVL